MKDQPMFSVVCLTYNHAAYIQQCIESVQQQTCKDWELLILDDGSVDGSGEQVRPYLKDERIRYFYQENKGSGRLSENYNFLLSKAQGTYITILEGDDYAEPGLLSSHREAMLGNPEAILSYNRVRVMDPGHFWEAPKPSDVEKDPAAFANDPVGSAYNRLFYSCFIPAQGTTVRRDVLLEQGGFEKVEELPTVDYPTWLKLASVGSFVFIPQTLAHWRRHGGQTTKMRVVKLYSPMIPVFEQVYDRLSPDIRSHVQVTKKQVMQFWAENMTKILIRGGKYQLQSRAWKEARKLLLESFTRWPRWLLFWRFQAVLGLIFSVIHIPWIHWYQMFSGKNSSE
ncbi:MAG: glycosyltransferase family 2 protein [Bacteroidales bacterium]|nr:glycosyltransferase family 2 protein [Bacteroidales bacterium]